MTITVYTAAASEPLTVSGIYAIRCLANGKAYVGSAVNLERRWLDHRKDLRRGMHHNSQLQNAWRKYGEPAFLFDVLERVRKEDLIPLEQKYMDEMDACNRAVGFNIAPRAGNTLGVKLPPLSKEHKERISAFQRARVMSPETCAKISASKKGKPKSAEHIAKLRAYRIGKPPWNKGTKASEELRLKLSAAHKGKTASAETREKMKAAHKGIAPSPQTIARSVELHRKFSDSELALVRLRLAEHVSAPRIAREFGCCASTVRNIKNGTAKVYR